VLPGDHRDALIAAFYAIPVAQWMDANPRSPRAAPRPSVAEKIRICGSEIRAGGLTFTGLEAVWGVGRKKALRKRAIFGFCGKTAKPRPAANKPA